MADVVLIHTPVGGGHKAAALAVAETARARGLETTVIDTFEHAPRWAADAYLGAHLVGQRAAPEIYGRMYDASNRQGAFEPLRRDFDNLIFGGLVDRVRALDPEIVIATHHLPLVVLGRARARGLLRAPLVGVVTDYTAHVCWAERGVDLWAVPFGSVTEELVEHGAPRNRIERTGIPVRASFERIPGVVEKKRLDVLVTTGGFGVGPVTRIVRSFEGIPDVRVTVVCGASEALRRDVESVAVRMNIDARVVGWEPDMPARIAEAQIVVGKGGGLTVTEVLTAGRCMIVAAAIPGNESANEDLVVRGGAGMNVDPDEVGRCAHGLFTSSAMIAMGRRARELVPLGAAENVVDLVSRLAS